MTKRGVTRSEAAASPANPAFSNWNCPDAHKTCSLICFLLYHLSNVSLVSLELDSTLVSDWGAEDMSGDTSNYGSGTKRKSEDGERNSRAKRNRYISIAWSVRSRRAMTTDTDVFLLPVTSARGERSR